MDDSTQFCLLQLLVHAEDDEIEAITAIISNYSTTLLKEPCRTSSQSGHAWVQEILQGHPQRCYDMFRMEKDIFLQLYDELVQHGLRPTRRTGIHEMVGMFLNIVGHRVGNRMAQERFQHSAETVHRHFRNVLHACEKLAKEYIQPKDRTFQDIHPKILGDPRYWPFFKDAIGAIDGTHIPCVVSVEEQGKYIGRKGIPTQNIMAACDWDICFTYVMAGWERTAHDARLFDYALTRPDMKFPHPPQGKYYLLDAGYPTPRRYLGPYISHRYHFPDFRRSSRFANNNEIFNYYHSSLRTTIERTFGV